MLQQICGFNLCFEISALLEVVQCTCTLYNLDFIALLIAASLMFAKNGHIMLGLCQTFAKKKQKTIRLKFRLNRW